MDLIDTGFGIAARFGHKTDAPLIFVYGGKAYATNLFKLHDTLGFSLTESICECRRNGYIPCTEQFIADAIRAGWSREKADAMVRVSLTDAIM